MKQTVSLLAGLAWLVIPKTWTHFSLGFVDFQSWRLFVVLCSIPSLSSALIIKLFMPESPKFLMEVRKKPLCNVPIFPWTSLNHLCPPPGWPWERSTPCLSPDVQVQHVEKRQRFPSTLDKAVLQSYFVWNIEINYYQCQVMLLFVLYTISPLFILKDFGLLTSSKKSRQSVESSGFSSRREYLAVLKKVHSFMSSFFHIAMCPCPNLQCIASVWNPCLVLMPKSDRWYE